MQIFHYCLRYANNSLSQSDNHLSVFKASAIFLVFFSFRKPFEGPGRKSSLPDLPKNVQTTWNVLLTYNILSMFWNVSVAVFPSLKQNLMLAQISILEFMFWVTKREKLIFKTWNCKIPKWRLHEASYSTIPRGHTVYSIFLLRIGIYLFLLFTFLLKLHLTK